MVFKTILKNPLFVIFLVFLAGGSISCDFAQPQTGKRKAADPRKVSPYFAKAIENGRIDTNEISEGSGLVNSVCNPDVLWAHNDSGDENVIYALSLQGKLLGKWRVKGAVNRDWEDIAGFRDKDGKCFLYIGDIGNNELERSSLAIYKVPEPKVETGRSKEKNETEKAEAIVFSYPDSRHNAEALAVHPVSGDIYVITKRSNGASFVYKQKAGSNTAEKVAEIELPSMPTGLVTGADISPDGRHVIVCDYIAGFEFTLSDPESDFDEIWKTRPRLVDLGDRRQGESVAYSSDGMAVFASSEHRKAPIYMTKRKG